MDYIAECTGTSCTIHESHNPPKRVEIKPGKMTVIQMRALAYTLRAMVGD